MVPLGTALVGGERSTWPTPTFAGKISSIVLSHGEFDDLYVTREAKKGFECDGTPSAWEYHTVIWARFNGTLNASNISDELLQSDFIRVKRRKKNTFKWITLFEIDPHTDPEGWQWFRYDKTAQSKTDYDYAVVPVSGGIEGNMNITSVYSCFEGLYVFDPGYHGDYYYSIAEYQNMIQRNKPVEVITTLGRTYPFTISNGMSNYVSGTVNALFMHYDWDTEELQIGKNVQYRDEVLEFLTSKTVKLLKDGNGRIWLIMVTSNPAENQFKESDPDEVAQISFDWVSLADPELGHDLYTHGFIDVDLDDFTIQ